MAPNCLMFILNSRLQQSSDFQLACFPCNLKLHTSVIIVCLLAACLLVWLFGFFLKGERKETKHLVTQHYKLHLEDG